MAKKKPAAEPEAQTSLLTVTDFLFFLCGEKDEGEDSFVYSLHERCAMLGVFRGLGGRGDRQYPALGNKTGACLAARAVCGAWRAWFEDWDALGEPPAEELEERIRRSLRLCRSRCGGESAAHLSSGAAVALCRPARGGVDVRLQWAGDARIFLLDSEGLAQLTEDDPESADPLGRLAAENGKAERPVGEGFHSARLTMGRPGLLFAATADCFRHLATPMELEYLLLSSLQNAPSVLQWEKALEEGLCPEAGEAFALSGISLNTGSFDNLKRLLAGRTSQVCHGWIRGLDERGEEEKRQLLARYKQNYFRLLCRR